MSIFNIEPNKVSTDLIQYPLIVMSESSGQGKTFTLNKVLREMNPEKPPLFIELEDRYQHIPGIMAYRVHDGSELESAKNELLLPQAKDMFSCVVIDTIDALDTLLEKSVAVAQEVEISGELKFGEGNKRIKAREYFIDELRNAGWQVFCCCQCSENKNIVTNKTTYEHKLNKVSWAKVSESAYGICMLTKDVKGERYLDFTNSPTYPNLKNSLGLPNNRIKASEFVKVLKDSIKKMGGDFSTNQRTIALEHKEEMTFEEVVKKGMDLCSAIYKAKKGEEVMNILKTTLGYKDDDNKQAKMFTDLVPAQMDVAKLCLVKVQALAKKYNIEL